MSKRVEQFLKDNNLNYDSVFFLDGLPGYAFSIDRLHELYVTKPEWEGFKLVDDMWLKYILHRVELNDTVWGIWGEYRDESVL